VVDWALVRLSVPNVAFKFTGLQNRLHEFEHHAVRLRLHASLEAIHWINITQTGVQCVTLI